MIEIKIYWDNGVESYSTSAIHYSTYQTKPYLLEISEISRAVNLDGSIENATVEILLSNHSGHFDDKIDELGRKIIILDENVTIFTGYISDFPESEQGRTRIKGDLFSFLQSPINLEITKDRFTFVPPENEGWGNILYGTANALPGMLNARRIDTNKYLASYSSLSALLAVQENGIDITAQATREVDAETGYTYINYNSSEPVLTFSALGPTSNGSLIENPALMLKELTKQFSTLIELEGIDESSVIFEERPYSGNILFIDDNLTWISLFQIFSVNFNCKIIFTRTGKVKIKVIRWGMETPVATILTNLVKDFKYSFYRNMKNRWSRQYQYVPTDWKYKRTPVDIPGNPNVKEVGTFEHRYISNNSTSYDVSLREAFFQKNKIIQYTFSLPRLKANSLELGDTVLIKSRKNLFKNEYRQVQILRETRKPGTGFVEFQGYDMNEINKQTFILQDTGHPDCAILGETENDSPILW